MADAVANGAFDLDDDSLIPPVPKSPVKLQSPSKYHEPINIVTAHHSPPPKSPMQRRKPDIVDSYVLYFLAFDFLNSFIGLLFLHLQTTSHRLHCRTRPAIQTDLKVTSLHQIIEGILEVAQRPTKRTRVFMRPRRNIRRQQQAQSSPTCCVLSTCPIFYHRRRPAIRPT
jgi:hypothetical protein